MTLRLRNVLSLEVTRFAAVGSVNTALDLGAYFVLQLAGLPVLLANLLSTSVGLGFSFVANRAFTFSGRPSSPARGQLLLFVACTGVGLWLVQPVVILIAGTALLDLPMAEALRILMAKTAAIAVGMIWNWTVYNKVVFRSVPLRTSPRAGVRPPSNGAEAKSSPAPRERGTTRSEESKHIQPST